MEDFFKKAIKVEKEENPYRAPTMATTTATTASSTSTTGSADPSDILDALFKRERLDEDEEEGERGGQMWRQVNTFQRLATRRNSSQRLFQATQLWLGARMVEASLAGEDWTALWSDAIDLSTKDSEIPAALASNAKGMLETTPEALLEWEGRWLDPAAGEPGWTWVIAGDAKQVRPSLRKLGVPVTRDRPLEVDDRDVVHADVRHDDVSSIRRH